MSGTRTILVAVSAAVLAGCGESAGPGAGRDAALSAGERPGSLASMLARGEIEGRGVPRPAVTVTLGDPEPIPKAPPRPPVSDLAAARHRALVELDSPNPHLRFVASIEAGALRIEAAVPSLAHLARSKEAAAPAAVRALGQIGGPAAARSLARLYGRARETAARLAITSALGATGEPTAVRPLARALRDRRTAMQMAAARALGGLGFAEAAPYLKSALMRKDPVLAVRVEVAVALARLGEREGLATLETAVTSASPELRAISVRGLAEFASALSRRDSDEAALLQARAQRTVAAALASPYRVVWAEALDALIATRPAAALAALEDMETAAPDVVERARLAKAAFGGAGSEETLRRAMASADAGIRAAACGVLGLRGDAEGDIGVTGALVSALGDDSPDVRAAAARGLANVGSPGAVRALLAAAAGEDMSLRAASLQALEAIRRTKGQEALAAAKDAPEVPPPAAGWRAEADNPGFELWHVVEAPEDNAKEPLCVLREPSGVVRALARGEAAGGYTVEEIVPDGKGGGSVVLARHGRSLALKLERKPQAGGGG